MIHSSRLSPLLHLLEIEGLRHAPQDVRRRLAHGGLGRGAAAAAGLAHRQEQVLHHGIGLVLLPGEVRIAMES